MSVRRIALIGLRATGKTTIGRAVAERLGWPFVDVDDVVEVDAGKSIAQIFLDDGEPAFRDREAKVISELCDREPIVISTGGGAVMRPATQARLKAACHVVWLTASLETMLSRMRVDPTTGQRRPKLTGFADREEVERLGTVRSPVYLATAHQIIDSETGTPDTIADAIIRHWNPHG